jgi:hypoxanthine phosphoribosyltransferase
MQYTIEAFCKDCKILADRVKEYPFTHILSVERGGGYVTRELIKYFPRAIVVPIRVSFYDGQIKRDTPIVEYPACKVFKETEKVLICDDLVDTGSSVLFLKNHHIFKNVGEIKVAVLIKKITSIVEPDFCVRKNITDWCVFPWEDNKGNHII